MQVSLLEWPLFAPDQVPGFLLAFWDDWPFGMIGLFGSETWYLIE